MKQERDINRMRNIISYIKVNVRPGGSISKPISEIDMYHMHLLKDAGFISCNFRPTKGGYLVSKIFLNNYGHDFYNSFEDEKVWQEVEKEVEKDNKKISEMALPALLNIAYKVSEKYIESNF